MKIRAAVLQQMGAALPHPTQKVARFASTPSSLRRPAGTK